MTSFALAHTFALDHPFSAAAASLRKAVVPALLAALAVVAVQPGQAQATAVSPWGSPQRFLDAAVETSPFAAKSGDVKPAEGRELTARLDLSLPPDFSVTPAVGPGFREAPSTVLEPEVASGPAPVATVHTKYIPADTAAQPLTPRDKFILGVQDLYSPFSITGSVLFATYSHAVDSQPDYGTDSGAFGQRVGATVLRDTNEGFFADCLLSSLFHEDPRYYVEGPKHNVLQRIAYAATRPLITRSDSGRSTLNVAVLVGYAGASAISYMYYPQINRNLHDTVSTFGGTLEGAAIGNLVSEFSAQVAKALHLGKKP